MGITLKNIITDYGGHEDDGIIDEIKQCFPLVQIKLFDAGFKGIIGQINEDKIFNECELSGNWNKYGIANSNELIDKIYELEDNAAKFSKKFPHKKFAIINVDCFGGTCSYYGFVVLNGEVIFNQPENTEGHIHILQQINRAYNSFYFEPFTRNFF